MLPRFFHAIKYHSLLIRRKVVLPPFRIEIVNALAQRMQVSR